MSRGDEILPTAFKLAGSSQSTEDIEKSALEFMNMTMLKPLWESVWIGIFGVFFALGLKEKFEAARKEATEWLMKQSCIIMSGGCRGMGMDGFLVSIHKNYLDFDKFMFDHKREMGGLVEDIQTVIVNLGGDAILKPLHLKYIAESK